MTVTSCPRAAIGFDNLSGEEAFTLACLGVIAFDHVDMFESLPANRGDPLGFPDYVFWLAESLILFEPGAAARAICAAFGDDDPEVARRAYFGAAERLSALVARCAGTLGPIEDEMPPASADPIEVDLDDDAFAAIVARLKGHIAEGDVYQIVPSRTFRAPCPDPLGADPFGWLLHDRRARNIPLILETPQQNYDVADEDPSGDPYDLRMAELLRDLEG